MYNPKVYSCQRLGQLFHVSPNMAWKVITNRNWKLNVYPAIWDVYNEMTDRNRLILLAKTEKGFGDGNKVIRKHPATEKWGVLSAYHIENPELTFEAEEEAETIIKMVRLNDN